MTATIKLRKIGNSTGTVFPKDILQRLNVEEGDELFIIETSNGIELSPYNQEFAKDVAVVEKVMKKRRNVLRKLAEWRNQSGWVTT